jgi:hypothetical protein
MYCTYNFICTTRVCIVSYFQKRFIINGSTTANQLYQKVFSASAEIKYGADQQHKFTEIETSDLCMSPENN